jgi:predicted Zn-dependent protease
MLYKIIFLLFLAVAVLILFFPSVLGQLFKKVGRLFGDVGRAGQELATGKEVRGSPLARYESAAGKAVEEKILATHSLHQDSLVQSRVAFVGSRIAASATRRELPYRFQVIDSPEPVAFSLPGGAILVSRPLVDLSGKDDNQLAGVLAHEVAHIDQRHAIRHLARNTAARTGLRILSLGRGALLSRAISSVEQLLETGYGQGEELEADRAALDLMARSGYDPRAYPFFLRSIRSRNLETRGYFSSHPSVVERLRSLGATP